MTRRAKSARAIRELDGLKGRNSHSQLCIFLAELCDLVAILAATSTTGGRGSVRAGIGTRLAQRLALPEGLSGARAEYSMPEFPVAPIIRPTRCNGI